jgi:hypothetical protein
MRAKLERLETLLRDNTILSCSGPRENVTEDEFHNPPGTAADNSPQTSQRSLEPHRAQSLRWSAELNWQSIIRDVSNHLENLDTYRPLTSTERSSI